MQTTRSKVTTVVAAMHLATIWNAISEAMNILYLHEIYYLKGLTNVLVYHRHHQINNC